MFPKKISQKCFRIVSIESGIVKMILDKNCIVQSIGTHTQPIRLV